ncbi:MAG TPA: glycoside hydrolase family 95 protein, partial [Rugosimonospora sp.]|nr:glycoside hydrolase family 95 protein [Rugosimonospora sp.]
MLELVFADPATAWEDALPVGNGRLGAMVRGGRPVERISLNEDTFWSGPADTAPPQPPPGLLDDVRALVRAGRPVAAGTLLRSTQGADAEAYQPIGDLEMEFLDATGPGYRRSLDLRDGVARVECGRLRQEVLASTGYQVVAVRLSTEDSAGLAVDLRWTTPQPRAQVRAYGADGLALLLAAPRHVIPWPRPDGVVLDDGDRPSIRAAALFAVSVDGGQARSDGPAVAVRDAAT